MDELFGEGLFMTMMLVIVVGLVAAAAFWAFRRFGGRGDSEVGGRSKQQRLGVLEELAVDRRRSLILIRRDNAEHLIMIGGPSDLVIESNIAKGAHLQTVRSEPVREEAPAPPPAPAREAREARDTREAPAAPPPRAPREKPLRPVEEPQPAAAQSGSSRRQPPAQDRDPPARRSETGLAAAANALELALRKPFGGGSQRQAPSAPEPLDADDDRALAPAMGDSAVTPFPAPAIRGGRGGDDAPYDLDAPAASAPPPAAMPRFLSGGGNSGSRREPPPAPAPRQAPPAAEGSRELPSRPTPFPNPARSARPASAAPPRERPSFGSRSSAGGSSDLVASRSERPAPLSLEDEMASLLDEISGVRERG